MKNIVFGFLGTKLDSGFTDKRWERWRPSVAMAAHEDFRIDVVELFLTSEDHRGLAEVVAKDIVKLQPHAQVNLRVLAVDDPWNFQQVYAALHDFAKGYAFGDEDAVFAHITTGTHVAQICMFLLTEARYFPGKILETRYTGADTDWRGSVETIDLDLSTYDLLAKRFEVESRESQDLLKGGIKTRNARFNALIGQIERVALKSSAPLLLCGPTGAGKSQLAKRVYELRALRHQVSGAFVEVNCATLRGDNAMSALFGHKKGAFTGAASDRPGLLRAADKGILFLDEVGELGLDEQAMLLRALEDKRFLPMGSDKEAQSDFQLICGTNKDLSKAVQEGAFRADLLARINLWTFELPGLAQRIEDLEPNLAYEMERASKELGTRVSMSKEAHARYLRHGLAHSWPGNFRDLSASVVRMATLAEGGRISEDDVKLELEHLARTSSTPAMPAAGSFDRCVRVLGKEAVAGVDPFDLAQLEYALGAIATSETMADAGRMLFSQSRQARTVTNDTDRVRKYLVKWGLDYAQVKAALAV
jgi:transcriptional regulatory protein RtcR